MPLSTFFRAPRRLTTVLTLGLAAALAGCATDHTRYPELARRAAETDWGTTRVAAAPGSLAPVPPALAAAAAAALAQLGAALPAQAAAQHAAQGAAPDSDAAAAARVAQGRLALAMGATRLALADFDTAITDARLAGADASALIAARARLTEALNSGDPAP